MSTGGGYKDGLGELAMRFVTTPVTGSYAVQIEAQDANGKTASASVPITVTAH